MICFDIYRMVEVFVYYFISSYKLLFLVIVIDFDYILVIIYGGQQMNLFNVKYQDYCYLFLMIFEGFSGKLIMVIFCLGKILMGKENVVIFEWVIWLFWKKWLKIYLLVWGDSYFV